MASNAPESNSPKPGALGSMLARLRGMAESVVPKGQDPQKPSDSPKQQEQQQPQNDVLPSWDVADSALSKNDTAAAEIPMAAPVAVAGVEGVTAAVASRPPAGPSLCPHCQAPRKGTQTYCDDCGWVFPPDAPAGEEAPADAWAAPAATPLRVKDRYELGQQIKEWNGVARFRGTDYGAGNGSPVPVTIVRGPVLQAAEALPAAEEAAPVGEDEALDEGDILPGFDDPSPVAEATSEATQGKSEWPNAAWERDLLQTADSPGLPRVLDSFEADGYEYLVEEIPTGPTLWDAWDEEGATQEKRFGLLKQVAQALHQLHQAGAMLEGIRPDIIAVTPSGEARLTDLADLLPLPLPPGAPVRGSRYTAPELVAGRPGTDARADLYSFGGMIYALLVGRELADMDFDKKGAPQPFIPRFPDIHPLLGRLITKTFVPEIDYRFPTDEAAKTDPTGFQELIRTLDTCQRTLDHVHLEIAAWTTTGMVRTGNEDAFALLHGMESRQDDTSECALVLLCDGMGGYEAGEVAAAMCIQSLRKNLLQQKPFAFLAGGSSFPADGKAPEGTPEHMLNVETCKKLLKAALQEANKTIFTASRSGVGRRGMGCTAEAVFVNSRNLIVGHVGDSRVYHLHEGRMIQVSRDQTLVNRLVELGTLSPEEAETHPRRNELQQAIGGRADVEPATYHGVLNPGDWVLVCSDGLSNHINSEEFKQMLQSEAGSAEIAARRLVNFVNMRGATDNATVVIIRAT